MAADPTSSRDKVLGAVKAALAPLPERAAMPEYPPELSRWKDLDPRGDLCAIFAEEFRKVHGEVLADAAQLKAFFEKHALKLGYCDPAVATAVKAMLPADTVIETVFDRAKVDEYQFGVTRADGAIAETGSLILTDRGTSSRMGSLAPWVHIAVLDPKAVKPTVLSAIEAFPDDPNIIFVTGPSKTADIEGILVEGVHGPGLQACLLLPA